MKKILLAVDGSETSLKATDEVLKLAKAFGSEVKIISVVYEQPIYPMPGAVIPPDLAETRKSLMMILQETAKNMLDHVAEKFLAAEIKVSTSIAIGRPSEEILSEAHQGEYDLVVVGSRGLTGIQRVLLGTVSGKIANNAKTSVLIIK